MHDGLLLLQANEEENKAQVLDLHAEAHYAPHGLGAGDVTYAAVGLELVAIASNACFGHIGTLVRALVQVSNHGLCDDEIDTDVRLAISVKQIHRLYGTISRMVDENTNERVVASPLPYLRGVAIVEALVLGCDQWSYECTDRCGRLGISASSRTCASFAERSTCKASCDSFSRTSCGT